MFEVEVTDQFQDWYESLDEGDQEAVAVRVELLVVKDRTSRGLRLARSRLLGSRRG